MYRLLRIENIDRSHDGSHGEDEDADDCWIDLQRLRQSDCLFMANSKASKWKL